MQCSILVSALVYTMAHTGTGQLFISESDVQCKCNTDFNPFCGTDGHTYINVCVFECEKQRQSRGPRKPECKLSDMGLDYVGKLSETRTGSQCSNWTLYMEAYGNITEGFTNPIQARYFPEGSVTHARNYCRNPDRDNRGPWCFTGRGSLDSYDFCDVTHCELGTLLDMAYVGECGSCIDGPEYLEQCPGWSNTGECKRNQAFMYFWCRRSCGICS